jgi:hypothetical protein
VQGAADSPEARVALSKILANLGIMQENEDELMMWIWSCKKRKDCWDLLSSALIFLAKNLIDYTEKQYELISSEEVVTKSHSMQLDELLEGTCRFQYAVKIDCNVFFRIGNRVAINRPYLHQSPSRRGIQSFAGCNAAAAE